MENDILTLKVEIVIKFVARLRRKFEYRFNVWLQCCAAFNIPVVSIVTKNVTIVYFIRVLES